MDFICSMYSYLPMQVCKLVFYSSLILSQKMSDLNISFNICFIDLGRSYSKILSDLFQKIVRTYLRTYSIFY